MRLLPWLVLSVAVLLLTGAAMGQQLDPLVEAAAKAAGPDAQLAVQLYQAMAADRSSLYELGWPIALVVVALLCRGGVRDITSAVGRLQDRPLTVAHQVTHTDRRFPDDPTGGIQR